MPTAPPLAKPATEPAAADVEKARSIFNAGGKAYEAGDFTTAIQAFEQAYALTGRDSIVFSIAQAQRQQFVVSGDPDHLVRAISSYRQFLASGKVGTHRAEATKALTDLEQIATTRATMPQAPVIAPTEMKTMITIDSPTPGALISLEGADPTPPLVSKEVPEGEYHVKLTAPGYAEKDVTVHVQKGQFAAETFELDEKPARLSLDVPSGADVSVDGRFVAKAPLTQPLDVHSGRRFVSVALSGHESKGTVVTLERGEDRKVAVELPSTPQRKASYAMFIVGGAATIATGVLAGIAIGEQSAAQDIANTAKSQVIPTTQATAYNADLDARNTFRTGAIGTGIGAGVVVLLGAALFGLDRPGPVEMPADMGPGSEPSTDKPKPKSAPNEMQLEPWFGSRAGGAGLRGTF